MHDSERHRKIHLEEGNFVVAITVIGAGEDMHGRITPREAEGFSAEKSPELSRNGPCRESSDASSVELQWW